MTDNVLKVLIAFVASAYFMLFISAFALNFRRDLDGNNVDRWYQAIIGRDWIKKLYPRKRELLRAATERLALDYGMQQIITALAILSVGLSRLTVRGGYITSYHLSIVRNLG